MRSESVAVLAGSWWTFVVRGVLALAFAALSLIEPGVVALALVGFLAAYFIISGVAAVAGGFASKASSHWWQLELMGVVQILLGAVVLVEPGTGALTLSFLVAIWAFSTGLMEISSAIHLRGHIAGEIWWLLLGLATLAFGFYVVLVPALGVLSLVFAVGFYCAVAGVALIGLGVRVRGHGRNLPAA